MASVSSPGEFGFALQAGVITDLSRHRVIGEQTKSIPDCMTRSGHEYRAVAGEFPRSDHRLIEFWYDFDAMSRNRATRLLRIPMP